MIRQKSILGIFKVLEIYYEPEQHTVSKINELKHSSVRIYSYLPLKLTGKYRLSRIKETTRVLLSEKTDETLLQSFKKNYRNEIRKTFNSSEYKTEIINGFSKEGYLQYKDFEKKSGRKFMSPDNMSGIWYLGYLGEELVSGVFLIDAKPVLKVVAIFSLRKDGVDKNSKIGFLSKRLIYDIGCFGIKNEYEFVDLAYINKTDPEKSGITAYKLGFGGDVVNEYLYETSSSLIRMLKKFKNLSP